jgi:hypothetical protein
MPNVRRERQTPACQYKSALRRTDSQKVLSHLGGKGKCRLRKAK